MSIRNSKGFTLLEILIVLIILGVIAGLAIPAFQNQVERGRAQEAYRNIALIRESLGRYHSQFGTFVGATINNAGCGAAQTLDFNPYCGAGNINLTSAATLWFDYAVGGLAAGTYTATATRANRPAGNMCNGQTIVVNQAGTATLGACYA